MCTCVCACVQVRACLHTCMLACAYSIMDQTAEVSDVYSITEINLELHINHTSNINDNIYTVYVSNIYTNISYPLTSAATDS